MADDNPGVIIRPPLLYLGTLVFGALVDWFYPASFEGAVAPLLWVQVAGAGIFLVGIAVMAAAMRRFREAGTNVPTNKPVNALVTVGIYQLTRNPIYVGMSCIYAGLSLLFDNPWALALLLPVLLIMNFGVIRREERYLEAKFGDPYAAYRKKVRRWL